MHSWLVASKQEIEPGIEVVSSYDTCSESDCPETNQPRG